VPPTSAHEVSDGQLQRACLARALAPAPDYLICDEMTTMLDASTTAALVAVIRAYQQQTGAGILAISHNTVDRGPYGGGLGRVLCSWIRLTWSNRSRSANVS
jgi:ABC-type Mn2+/Zn2+ transport system ATPase subunit